MTLKENIKSRIIKSLESATNDEIADAYNYVVSCGDCPYWRDCKNENLCGEYILNKLEGIINE